ncbi:hypothetical protein SAMN04515674_102344 [Pseudarcicella hirudinis]|uniref:Uncharacterized protein n=1 Tax=Pseudarcicella hirudinis TaxID=1079859 RepID=A0A1I5PAD5_9BACT|nr:hypothetical protein [Pseudarcicella hirudinis]SFP30481.1 hypothetical protein SAMN04515674_102344 [Pseudarcicella hirudinis]
MNQRIKDLQSFFKKEYNLDLSEQEVLKLKDTIQEILSIEKYYQDDLIIQKGDEYLCIKTLKMANGLECFIKGKIYISPENEKILNENGEEHIVPEKCIKEHFRKTKNLVK